MLMKIQKTVLALIWMTLLSTVPSGAEPSGKEGMRYPYRDHFSDARAETSEGHEASSYKFLAHSEVDHAYSYGAVRAVSNLGTFFQIGKMYAVTEGKRIHRLETESGWWIEIRDEMPIRFSSLDESGIGPIVMQKYRDHMEDPYTLSIQWKSGPKVSVSGPWMDSTISVTGEALLQKVVREGVDGELRKAAPKELKPFLKDLNDIHLCESCGALPDAERFLQILLPLLDESGQPTEAPRRVWTHEYTNAVSYRSRDEPPAYEAARFLEDFPMANVDNYREVFIKTDEKKE